MKRKIAKFAVVAIVVVIVVILIYQATPGQYLTVSDAVNNYNNYRGSQVQVMGNVSQIILASAGNLAFTITDGKAFINVTYTGASALNINKGLTVAVIGKLVSKNLIQATQILTKCPSKYG